MFFLNKKPKFGNGRNRQTLIGDMSDNAGRNPLITGIAFAMLFMAAGYIAKNNAASAGNQTVISSNLTVADTKSAKLKQALGNCLSQRADGSPAIKRVCLARIAQRAN